MAHSKLDLKETWCKATKENYDALIANGVRVHFPYANEYRYLSVNFHYSMWATKFYGKEEVHLVDGEFELVKGSKDGSSSSDNTTTDRNNVVCNPFTDGNFDLWDER